MNISLDSFHSQQATFLADSLTKAGYPVVMKENLTVTTAATGGAFCGFCTDVRGGYATVRLSGYCTAKYSGTAPAVGYALLAADGDGGVKTVTTGGRSLLVTNVDTTAKTIGIILN